MQHKNTDRSQCSTSGIWNQFCAAIQNPIVLKEVAALTWRVCSFWNVLRFFWCSKDIGCHPVWPAWRRNFFCTPKEITRTSSWGLQYPTLQNERRDKKVCLKFTAFNIFDVPSSFSFVCYNYSDLNLLQVIPLCPWSIYFSRAVLIKYSQVQHKYCQPLNLIIMLSTITRNSHKSATRTNGYAMVFQKQQEIKRRPMTPVSILRRNSTESDFLLNCTYQLCICDTIQTHWLLIKADIS